MRVWCALFLSMIFPAAVLGCSCPPVEFACEGYSATPIIFAGTVVHLGARENTPKGESYSQEVEFEVNEAFKGTRPGFVTLTHLHFQSSCPSSTPEFVVGGRYLVWAYYESTDEPVIADCNPTRLLADAAQFVADLRELSSGQGATYVFGSLYRDRVWPSGVRPDEMQNYSSLPLGGTRVTVSSRENSYTAVTDGKGHFVVPLQRGGDYQVNINLPGYFTQEGLNREVSVKDHQCVNMSLWPRYSFPFKGRVVDINGVPVARVPISLLSVPKLDSFDYAVTDDSGNYELSASEPGEYLIAVNWDEPPSEGAPFSTTFYAGAQDTPMASPVHTEEAGPVALADFRLPAATKCSVEIQLDNFSSKQPGGATILTKYFPEQFWHSVADVDRDGKANVTLIGPNLTYLVASTELSGQLELRSPVQIIRSCPTRRIHLRLTDTVHTD